MRSCNLASGSPGKLGAKTKAFLNALASWLTAELARSLSLQTCRRDERDEQAENDAERGQHARRNGFERFGASASGQRRNASVDSECKQIGDAENQQRHPEHRQFMEPVVHRSLRSCLSELRLPDDTVFELMLTIDMTANGMAWPYSCQANDADYGCHVEMGS